MTRCDMSAGTPTHLFVYGSLRVGSPHPLARRLAAGARHVGTGWIAGRLYDLGPYPAAVTVASGRERVVGDVFAFRDDRLLAALDAYEGCAPHQREPRDYVRTPVEVRLRRGIVTAWAYLFAGDPAGRRIVPSGDYSAYRVRFGPRPRG